MLGNGLVLWLKWCVFVLFPISFSPRSWILGLESWSLGSSELSKCSWSHSHANTLYNNRLRWLELFLSVSLLESFRGIIEISLDTNFFLLFFLVVVFCWPFAHLCIHLCNESFQQFSRFFLLSLHLTHFLPILFFSRPTFIFLNYLFLCSAKPFVSRFVRKIVCWHQNHLLYAFFFSVILVDSGV